MAWLSKWPLTNLLVVSLFKSNQDARTQLDEQLFADGSIACQSKSPQARTKDTASTRPHSAGETMDSAAFSYVIRRAQPADTEAIARLELDSAAYEGRLEPLNFTPTELARLWQERIRSLRYEVLVAEAGQTLLGFVGIMAPAGGNGFIQAIYIAPAFYHRGIGTQLLQVCEKIFKLRKCPRVVLYVEPKNHNGQSFYRKAGYVATNQKFRHLTVWVKEFASSC